MKCPKCFGTDISIIGDHYMCNNESCFDNDGNRTQFEIIEDEKIKFPYNQIFRKRLKREFNRYSYIKIKPVSKSI